MGVRLASFVVGALAVTIALACGPTPRALPPCVEPAPDGGARVETGGDPVIIAAGDIADPSDIHGAQATAALVDRLDGVVAVIGDAVHRDGSVDDFLDHYAPAWGRHRWRTRPAVGNHEYTVPHAGGYFAYFCAAAGEPFRGWYSYDVGRWHVVVLVSECAEDDSEIACDAGSEQVQWLRADLAAHPTRCTLAYAHHPRFSSGFGGDHVALHDVWVELARGGVDLVLAGHSHDYERFAPQTPDGALDPAHGIREIVAGTGGAALGTFDAPRPNSEVRLAGVWGVLVLTLHAEGYDWRFVAVDGTTQDFGSAPCR
jgi:hypothetical protein